MLSQRLGYMFRWRDKVFKFPVIHVLLGLGGWGSITFHGASILAAAKLKMVELGGVGLFGVWRFRTVVGCSSVKQPVLTKVLSGTSSYSLNLGIWETSPVFGK